MVVKPRKEGQERPVAVLCSGGLDSAVLVAHKARDARVHPVYVRAGLAWEPREEIALSRLLAAPPLAGRLEPLASLEATVRESVRPDPLGSAGHAARLRHAGQRRVSGGAQCHAARQGRSALRPASDRRDRAGTIGRQSVSGTPPRRSSTRWPGRCHSVWVTSSGSSHRSGASRNPR